MTILIRKLKGFGPMMITCDSRTTALQNEMYFLRLIKKNPKAEMRMIQ